MKKTEYLTIEDAALVDLFLDLGDKYSNLELIDEEKDLDVVVLSNSDWQYLLEQLDDEVKEQFLAQAETDFLDEE
ncbi:hypothetical protein [Enterococcus gallinarum]|uniref:hypothetical protein n=1 Tax=Enterococcus gallinarum TaxID=1353 RepID=UPI00214CDA12|nr:hypothetical protein [Enterococcus gallinarum]MCR1931226.1 hypothetical protein [Enterococcus gallinarum]